MMNNLASMKILSWQDATRNVVLRSLSDEMFDLISPYLAPCELPVGFRLAEPNRDCSWVYFPTSGVASVIGRVQNEWQEIGLFGQEGVGCLSAMLGSKRPPYLVMMQVAGFGYRAPAEVIVQLFRDHEDFRDVMLRYLQAYMIQIAQSSIANSQYNTVQRMAHWLLMIHDRVEVNSIHLTHEGIAAMLGVGRTGVTLALHALEANGMITTARKRITILDRARLEEMTRSVYGLAEAEYRRLLGSVQLPHSNLSAAVAM